MKHNTIRPIVRGAYDLQKLRIQLGNRIAQNWKIKNGQEPGKKEDGIDPEAKKILDVVRSNYKLITEGLMHMPSPARFKANEIISTYEELTLVAQYEDMLTAETSAFKRLGKVLEGHPIYTSFLKDVRGIGPAMAGVIISEIDITKAKYPASLWKLAGIDVAGDGGGRSRRKEHLVDREYIDKHGKKATRKSITFNPFLKTKLTGVLADSFIKQRESPYRAIYDAYKHRLENHPRHIEKTKLHRHRMALRYMIKMFLVDLYREWRTLEGLPVAPTYEEAKLGHKHGEAA